MPPLTEMESAAGVVPVVGVTESQFTPAATALFAAAVKLSGAAVAGDLHGWAGGFAPLS